MALKLYKFVEQSSQIFRFIGNQKQITFFTIYLMILIIISVKKYFRAKFSEITKPSIERALQTLGEPDKAMSDAVDVRSELDLRIGII